LRGPTRDPPEGRHDGAAILDDALDDELGCFGADVLVPVDERDVGVVGSFHHLHQVGVEVEGGAVDTGELNHGEPATSPPKRGFRVGTG
jgi:hypothetical protein